MRYTCRTRNIDLHADTYTIYEDQMDAIKTDVLGVASGSPPPRGGGSLKFFGRREAGVPMACPICRRDARRNAVQSASR